MLRAFDLDLNYPLNLANHTFKTYRNPNNYENSKKNKVEENNSLKHKNIASYNISLHLISS